MRIIICGSRGFNDYNYLEKRMDKLTRKLKEVVVVSGHARGADQLGEKWAYKNQYKVEIFPANWLENGRAAGILRNKEMVDSEPGAVVAFYDGISHGTGHTIEYALSKGIKTKVYLYLKDKDYKNG